MAVSFAYTLNAFAQNWIRLIEHTMMMPTLKRKELISVFSNSIGWTVTKMTRMPSLKLPLITHSTRWMQKSAKNPVPNSGNALSSSMNASLRNVVGGGFTIMKTIMCRIHTIVMQSASMPPTSRATCVSTVMAHFAAASSPCGNASRMSLSFCSSSSSSWFSFATARLSLRPFPPERSCRLSCSACSFRSAACCPTCFASVMYCDLAMVFCGLPTYDLMRSSGRATMPTPAYTMKSIQPRMLPMAMT
mmetsp:Transcript_4674/g.16303  ORF Transcript_4674/g.16303 Transcript_4674/m.16303 type:complete len:247 (-) Transcript_4674:239-979(-)